MKLQKKIFQTSEEASRFLALHIVRKINDFDPSPENPFVLGLPTGNSPEGVYAELVRAYRRGYVSFSNVVTFNMDEYVGMAPSHPQSYNYYMYDKLFNHTDFKRDNIHILNGLEVDLEAECTRYEKTIQEYAPIHLFVGGLGPNGHLAFNEAGSVRNSQTRVVELAQSTKEANSRFFGNDIDMVPTHALTVGISTILDNSQEIALIVLGSGKQIALKNLQNGPSSLSDFPASFLKEHPKVMIVCDELAAGSEILKL